VNEDKGKADASLSIKIVNLILAVGQVGEATFASNHDGICG